MYHPQLAIFALSLCTTRNWPFFSLGGIRGVQHRNMSPRGFMHVLSQRKEVGRVVHRNMSPRGLTHVLSTGVPSRAATCARPWLRGALLDRWLLAGRALSLARALRPSAVAAGTMLHTGASGVGGLHRRTSRMLIERSERVACFPVLKYSHMHA
jgi:hypothetical protein